MSVSDEQADRRGAEALRDRFGEVPSIGMVLGSGWGGVLDAIEDAREAAYADLPGFPAVSVPGHRGTLTAGRIGRRRILAFAGRLHPYEGASWRDATAPIRAFVRAGGRTLVLTNAAGGIREDLEIGDILCIDDHLNLTGDNPLRGLAADGAVRFCDMTDAYDPGLRHAMDTAARDAGIPLKHGIYAAMGGPSYETPAEVRMLRTLGADAVGMSTVGETIMARALGIRVAALSCITNRAAGTASGQLSHEEVMNVLRRRSADLTCLLQAFMGTMQ